MIFCKKNYQNFTTDDYSGEYLDFKKFCIYKSQKKEQAFTYQALMFNQTFHLIRMQTSLGFKALREQFEKLSIHGSFKQRERREPWQASIGLLQLQCAQCSQKLCQRLFIQQLFEYTLNISRFTAISFQKQLSIGCQK